MLNKCELPDLIDLDALCEMALSVGQAHHRDAPGTDAVNWVGLGRIAALVASFQRQLHPELHYLGKRMVEVRAAVCRRDGLSRQVGEIHDYVGALAREQGDVTASFRRIGFTRARGVVDLRGRI